MQYYISSDIEGMSGYGHQERPVPDMELQLAHMSAVARGLNEGGAASITLTSFHGIPDGLPAYVRPIRSRRADEFDLPEFTSAYAGLVMLGFHGTRPGWAFGHSYRFDHLILNGRQCGEVTIQMLLAASKGVPTVMMAGDNGGVTEARALVPEILTVITRPAREGDEGPMSAEVLERVRQTACQCVGHTIAAPPIPAELLLEVPFRSAAAADLAERLPYAVTRTGLTVGRRAGSVAEMYRFLLDTFQCVTRAQQMEAQGKRQ